MLTSLQTRQCVSRPVAAARLQRSGRKRCCRVQARSTDEPHLQLATAKLPPAANPKRFEEAMWQWATTVTQSGANFPMILPVKADRLPGGFQISLLKRGKSGGFDSAADITGTVEQVPQGNVLMVRFFEGPTAQDYRMSKDSKPPADPTERLEMVLATLPDVDSIMNSMPQAIRTAVLAAQES